MSEQSQVPETPDHDPREGGFGPGEKGESIEDGRPDKQDEQGSGKQESDDSETLTRARASRVSEEPR